MKVKTKVKHKNAFTIKKGKVYADFVITIKSTETYDSIEVYRNRTGTLIMAIEKTKNVSFNWEYIFVENHIKKLIKNSIK